MSEITLPFLAIILLFVFLLTLKKFVKLKYCTICMSVSLTWGALLLAHWYGVYSNLIVIAVLMGQSAVGFYYLLERRVKEGLLLFRLPFLLTETWVILFVLGGVAISDRSSLLIVLSWGITLFLYVYRNNKRVNIIVKRVIACCKDW